MNKIIDGLAFVMTAWMLYCFVRHGIYPAIRLVFRLIGATVCLVAGYLPQNRCDAAAEHVAEVCATPLIAAEGSQRTNHD